MVRDDASPTPPHPPPVPEDPVARREGFRPRLRTTHLRAVTIRLMEQYAGKARPEKAAPKR